MSRKRAGRRKQVTPETALAELQQRRKEAESRLASVRTSIDREVSWLPIGLTWTVPLVGFACGIALALALAKGGRSGNSDKASDDE